MTGLVPYGNLNHVGEHWQRDGDGHGHQFLVTCGCGSWLGRSCNKPVWCDGCSIEPAHVGSRRRVPVTKSVGISVRQVSSTPSAFLTLCSIGW